MAGELDALVESFAGEPELHHPVRGRIRGTRAFEAFVTETRVARAAFKPPPTVCRRCRPSRSRQVPYGRFSNRGLGPFFRGRDRRSGSSAHARRAL